MNTLRRQSFSIILRSYFRRVEKNSLIGTNDWELKLGTGMIKGFSWGTITFRAAVNYSAAEKAGGVGEYALEYLKRLSKRFRFFAMVALDYGKRFRVQ